MAVYNDLLLILPSILFGALLTLAIAWMLGNLCLRRLPVPPVITLAVGAAAESCIVFLLLVARVGNRTSFLLLGAVCLGLFLWRGRDAQRLTDVVTARADRISIYLTAGTLAAYGVLYLMNAMAPELEPDAIAYHLGFTAEYVRLGRFPHRVGFYEMLPQGFEMLYVPAFAFGRHSAAKLVQFAFLVATLPLIWRIGRRLQLPDAVSLGASVIYACTPVVGITGTTTYTDAGGVFYVLATFYLLLVWRATGDTRYMLPAGITAGFCYAIKFPGGLIAVLALLFIFISHERNRKIWKPAALLCLGTLLMAAPWMARSLAMTGNPVAPLFNRFFPNPYFHLAMEKDLAASLGSFQGLPPWSVIEELLLGGRFQGNLGPVYFVLPLALLALRRQAGRWCWAAAALLALPWFWNTGARFLMPSLPFLALALTMAVPKPVAWACMLVQALACWPQIAELYQPGFQWRLQRIPWRAALHIQPEEEYLASLINEYRVARMVEEHTQPGEKIYSLISVPAAYTEREVLEFWHSSEADNLGDALRVALSPQDIIFDVKADWAPRPLSGLRIRTPEASRVEWIVHDIVLFIGDDRVSGNSQWQLNGWPNEWDLPLAFDANRATRWRSYEPIRPGMYMEAEFDRPRLLSSALMTTPDPLYHVPFEFYGRVGGQWRLLTDHPAATQNKLGEVRMDATQNVRRAGYKYILVNNGEGGNGPLGAAMVRDEVEWGLERVAELGQVVLFRVK